MVLFSLKKKKKENFCKINADISKIKKALILKGIFSETIHVCVCIYVPNFKFLA